MEGALKDENPNIFIVSVADVDFNGSLSQQSEELPQVLNIVQEEKKEDDE